MLAARLYHKVRSGHKRGVEACAGQLSQKPQTHLPVFERKQSPFHVQTTGETMQAAVRTDDPVAWYDERNRIVTQGCACSLGAAGSSAHLRGNPAIGAGFPIADAQR